jgi:hypothetical protein
VLSGWHADTAFAPLHARPYTAFGTDPAGWTGGQLDIAFAAPPLFDWSSAGVAAGERRAFSGAPGGREALELHGFGLRRLGRGWEAELRARARSERQEEGTDRTLRLALRRPGPASRLTLRADLVRSGSAEGGLVGAGWRGPLAGMLEGSLALHWLDRSGSGVVMSVVEPSAPGLLPVLRLGSNRWRAAGRLDFRPAGGVLLWIVLRYDHPLRDGGSEAAFAAGFEWTG